MFFECSFFIYISSQSNHTNLLALKCCPSQIIELRFKTFLFFCSISYKSWERNRDSNLFLYFSLIFIGDIE